MHRPIPAQRRSVVIHETVFIVGAIAFVILALYHLVGLPLARDIKFFLPIKVAVGLSLIMIILGLQQFMLGLEKTIYLAGTLVLVYMGVLCLALRLLFPKRTLVGDKDVVPEWFPVVDDDRFSHG